MAPRVTRGNAAREAALSAPAEKERAAQQLSSTPATPATLAPAKKRAVAPKKKAANREATATPAKTTITIKTSAKFKEQDAPIIPAVTTKKRKRTSAAKTEDDPVELPHGLGKLWKPTEATPETAEAHMSESALKAQAHDESAVKKIESIPSVAQPTELAAAVAATDAPEDPPTKKSRKKANPYGLTPGISPFPDWPHPTAEECRKVHDLLSTIHGTVKVPEAIPEPSATVAGCGEVPSVLDALIRTLLSAATSGSNSSRAFQGLIEEYGQKKTGIGKGSVDWDAVRRSDVSRVFNAIKSGGLADVKSKKIKQILDMVYEENQARRNALVRAAEEPDGEKAATIAPKGAEHENEEAKALEIQGADEDVLSLDYLHSMPNEESFNHMLRYPGIGVKTASCVTLFCLRRPSFAVDTHVFRLCQWLGWVPEKANRDTTFMHCEVMVPDELKYPLHQLLIQHGKKCGRCRAITGESSEGWAQGCVIDHLVTRTGVRKGGPSPVKAKRAKKAKKGEETDEDEDEDIDMDGEESYYGTLAKKKAKKATPNKTPSKVKKEEEAQDRAESDSGSPAKKKATKAMKATPKKTPSQELETEEDVDAQATATKKVRKPAKTTPKATTNGVVMNGEAAPKDAPAKDKAAKTSTRKRKSTAKDT
ncbi:MAG: hypothetical protein Q9166_005209 [cf. Caloplaca sp. 2 TL-2023]